MFEKNTQPNSLQKKSDWTSTEDNGSQGAFVSLRELLSLSALANTAALPDIELIPILNRIEVELMQAGIIVDFLDRLPAQVAFKGLQQMLDNPIALSKDSLGMQHLDGCDSACESCFQLQHCSIAKKVLGSEWKVAVEEAHINPSWSALFSRHNTH